MAEKVCEKVCFVTSPMGSKFGRTRARANFVYETYIKPACREAGYEALRSQDDLTQNIVAGITTSLQNAPMAIAYMGSPVSQAGENGSLVYWNANVMIEVGLRNATRLPLVYLCDLDDGGNLPSLPLSLQQMLVVGLPATPPPAGQAWGDPNVGEVVEEIVKYIRAAESSPRYLDSVHPLVDINASRRDSDSSDNLLYASASLHAVKVFGKKVLDGQNHRPKLIGLTMHEFLDTVKARMHPVQWKMFSDDQARARQELRDRMDDKEKCVAKARIPIVFETHDNPEFIGRAYLPVIVREFTPGGNGGCDWYNVRVLYLNVTGVTRQVRNDDGEFYYVCDYDPTYDVPLKPLPTPIKVFISYSHSDEDAVKKVYEMMAGLAPYVTPFLDRVDIHSGELWGKRLQEELPAADASFAFFGKDQGTGQSMELDSIVGLMMERKEYLAQAVLLDGVNLIPQRWSFLRNSQYVKSEVLTADALKRIFYDHFRHRCPSDWGRFVVPSVKPSAEPAAAAGR